METIIGIIIGTAVSLLIFYYVIKAAVKDAISDKMKYYMWMQDAYLKFLAKQAGMTDGDIKKAWEGIDQAKK